MYGVRHTSPCFLLNADDTQIITEKEQILDRWAEHFNKVLNCPAAINDNAIARLPQVELNSNFDASPSEAEVSKAIKQLSGGKAPGDDAIPAEIYKLGGPAIVHRVTELLEAIWSSETVPQQWKDASIISIYKRKGSRHLCDNYRGISLLCIAGKILARILLNRLTLHLEQGLLPESQCGFRSERGTADMIFAARQIQEKCQEKLCSLYMTFVDLTKAFDTVSREGLWKIMGKFGCPPKFTNIVRQLHDGMMAKVMANGEESRSFPVTNGVKQGCVLAPTLFSMVFSAMLTDAFKDCNEGIHIRYRTDKGLFNQKRMLAVTKVKETVVRDLLFADDCALCAETESKMQNLMDCFSEACDNFGLTINTKKTEVLHQPAPGISQPDPGITIKGQTLKVVDKFTYLGSTLARTANIDDEICNRIAKASITFGRLRENVWERKGLRLDTKLKVYNATILPTLLYASETWTVYSRHARQLNHFHVGCLRKLLKIRWQDKIPDTEVLQRAGSTSIFTELLKSQARWAGHLVRMPDYRLPKKLLFGELAHGKRKTGGQKKRFKDNLKASLKALEVEPGRFEDIAADRSGWRKAVKCGAQLAENDRLSRAVKKRVDRKARQTRNVLPDPTAAPHVCNVCNKTFKAHIGLVGHQRTHSATKRRGHPRK